MVSHWGLWWLLILCLCVGWVRCGRIRVHWRSVHTRDNGDGLPLLRSWRRSLCWNIGTRTTFFLALRQNLCLLWFRSFHILGLDFRLLIVLYRLLCQRSRRNGRSSSSDWGNKCVIVWCLALRNERCWLRCFWLPLQDISSFVVFVCHFVENVEDRSFDSTDCMISKLVKFEKRVHTFGIVVCRCADACTATEVSHALPYRSRPLLVRAPVCAWTVHFRTA